MNAMDDAHSVATVNRLNGALQYLALVKERLTPPLSPDPTEAPKLIPHEDEVRHRALDFIDDFIAGKFVIQSDPRSPIPDPQSSKGKDATADQPTT